MMRPNTNANLFMLESLATKLDNLCDVVVFLGGCTTALFINDPVSPDIRVTTDVDCIIDVISLQQYHKLSIQLKEKGFKQSLNDAVICRWHIDDLILDIMPTDERILGFGNIWYRDAIKQARNINLSGKLQIKTVTAPYFLATKLEAFKTRGKKDYFVSHDFEDIISVLDGCIDIVLACGRSIRIK